MRVVDKEGPGGIVVNSSGTSTHYEELQAAPLRRLICKNTSVSIDPTRCLCLVFNSLKYMGNG